MSIIFFGAFFLIQAILHGLGLPFFLSTKHREAYYRREFQKGLVLPFAILGISWMAMGIYSLEQGAGARSQMTFYLLIMAVIPLILAVKNKKKFDL